MAQILKEEQRKLIITSAINEFLNKGYKDTTMRSIAKNANMTVGNLYRYFSNKEGIHLFIVGPVLSELNDTLKALTGNTVSMDSNDFNLKPDINELTSIFDSLADSLVKIYEKHSLEFKMVVMQSGLNSKIIDWFSEIVYSIIDQKYASGMYEKEKKILSHGYAVSISRGLTDIFLSSSKDVDLRTLTKVYLRSYVVMLDNDIRKFVD